MNELIKKMKSRWHRNPGATEGQICRTETQLGISFPDDYRQFLAWSNGGFEVFGEHYVSLQAVEDIPEYNEKYQIGEYLPNVIAIGTNRGGLCYALDYRGTGQPPPLVQVPFGDLSPESVTVLGDSLTSWLAKIVE